MQSYKPIKHNQRYGSESLEIVNLRPNTYFTNEVQAENMQSLDPVVNFRKRNKLINDVQITHSQQFPCVNEFDHVQDWIINGKKRSVTLMNQQQFKNTNHIKNNLIKSQQIMEQNKNYRLASQQDDQESEYNNRSDQASQLKSQFKSKSQSRFKFKQETYPNQNMNKNTFNKNYLTQQLIRNSVIDQISKRNLKPKLKPGQKSCGNCQDKRAKYHLLNNKNGELFFCSKCSIKLLQKGYKVQQIQEYYNMKNQHARTQLLIFMDKLNEIKRATTQNIRQITNGGDYSSIQTQKQSIQNNYQTLFEVLNRMKQKQIKQLQKVQSNIKIERENVSDKLMNQLEEIQGMQQTIKETYQNIDEIDSFKVEKMIEIYSKDLMEFQQFRFSSRPIQTQPFDLRLQKLLNGVYQEILVGEQSSFISLQSQNQGLNYTDATIQEIKQPFRFLFPDDNDQQSTKQKFYLNDN